MHEIESDALAPEFRDLPDADLCTIAADILFRRIT
jgi:hypothetical protein